MRPYSPNAKRLLSVAAPASGLFIYLYTSRLPPLPAAERVKLYLNQSRLRAACISPHAIVYYTLNTPKPSQITISNLHSRSHSCLSNNALSPTPPALSALVFSRHTARHSISRLPIPEAQTRQPVLPFLLSTKSSLRTLPRKRIPSIISRAAFNIPAAYSKNASYSPHTAIHHLPTFSHAPNSLLLTRKQSQSSSLRQRTTLANHQHSTTSSPLSK